jgi:hypothetical protein
MKVILESSIYSCKILIVLVVPFLAWHVVHFTKHALIA